MKILNCPLNGPRNIAEFTYGGEFHVMPDPASTDVRAWAEYVFFPANRAGVVAEWWCHTASAYWFIAERDTRTDRIVATYAPGDYVPLAHTKAGPDDGPA